jgi:ATP-dependent RNA helicase DHX29
MDVFVAQDSALQRRGRAGRVKPGTCFHLFTSFRYENRLRKETLPEILRQSLDEFILTLRLQAHTEPLREIFNLLITPPHQSALHHSIKRLQYIQALNTVEQLTPLGAQLGGFPADAHLAKMVLLGALFKCMDPVLTVAATLSYKSPFVRPFGKETEAGAARAKFKTGDSDFLSYWAVYSTWRRLRESNGGGMKESLKFCQQNFLNFNTLQAIDDLKRQFHEHLASIGAVPEPSRYTDEDLNANSRQLAVVNAVISAGLYPKIAIYENRSLTIYAAAD